MGLGGGSAGTGFMALPVPGTPCVVLSTGEMFSDHVLLGTFPPLSPEDKKTQVGPSSDLLPGTVAHFFDDDGHFMLYPSGMVDIKAHPWAHRTYVPSRHLIKEHVRQFEQLTGPHDLFRRISDLEEENSFLELMLNDRFLYRDGDESPPIVWTLGDNFGSGVRHPLLENKIVSRETSFRESILRFKKSPVLSSCNSRPDSGTIDVNGDVQGCLTSGTRPVSLVGRLAGICLSRLSIEVWGPRPIESAILSYTDQIEPMLFELQLDEDGTDELEPQPFLNLQQIDRLEKDLEDILADHLYHTLYQQAPLMPFFQERAFQEEADLYALNEKGDLVIFELKRGGAGGGAIQQILRYAQEAGQWSYTELSERYDKYTEGNVELTEAHQEEFELDDPLSPEQFNHHQQLRVVGNAADTKLVEAVEYWTGQGLDLSFVPYRIYEIGGSHYFEFFAKPNDQRVNPADRKGVLFDTNRSYNENAIWDMIEKERIAAYGGSKKQADRVDQGDLVFYSHKGHGIVAAAKVLSETKSDGEDELYHDVEFLTPTPSREGGLPAISFSKVSDVTGESFFWARTVKNPYLTLSQANDLLDALQKELQPEG